MMLTFPPRRAFATLLAVTLFTAAAQSGRADPVVYQQAARSTVIVLNNGKVIGSGVLVDVDRRLVATANHVAATFRDGRVEVLFADREPSGKVITDWTHYRRQRTRLALRGRVIKTDAETDLALIRLETLPAAARAIPLAADAASPGERVHVIGHSDIGDGAVFSYCTGCVRASGRLKNGVRRLIHATPTNPGDSGGPLVNDKGELVGLVSGGTTGMSMEQVAWMARRVFRQLQQAGAPRADPMPPPREPQVRDLAADVRDLKALLDSVPSELGASAAPAP